VSCDNDYVLGVADIHLVVVGLILHASAILGWGYDLAVYYSAVLGQLQENLVAVDINGLDSQLVALFQLEGRAGGDGHLIVVVYQDLEKLLVGENILIVGLLKEYIVGALGINVAGEVLLGHESDYQEVAPGIEVEVVLHSRGFINHAIGLQELPIGYCCGQRLSLDVIIDIIVEAGKVFRIPAVTTSGNMAADFD